MTNASFCQRKALIKKGQALLGVSQMELQLHTIQMLWDAQTISDPDESGVTVQVNTHWALGKSGYDD